MTEKKVVDEALETAEQAVESAEKFAKETEKMTASEPVGKAKPEQVIVKKGGSGMGFLALLVALGVGGAGYYFGTQKMNEVESRLQQLGAKQVQTANGSIELPNFDAEKAQIAELVNANQKATEKLAQLEQAQTAYVNQINGLQAQIQRLTNTSSQADSTGWLLSDADFLLNNALRKVVLDNDIDTAKSLLNEADSVLSKLPTNEASAVRAAIQTDLNTLNEVNKVNQNDLMQRLTTLANRLDDLPMLENEAEQPEIATGEVSDSIDDWQQNLEKSANSFLDHFIRVSDRNKAEEKGFVAPNQEVYLRENIRLRLQIAILAIPRQQNELYKKSLDAVSTWIRSYFDTKNENVKNFLKEIDELSEQSVYIDAPDKLQSLVALEKLLNRVPQVVEKVEIKAEKDLNTPSKHEEVKAEAKTQEANKAEQAQPQSEQQATPDVAQ